jgi:hypothetical protein
MAVDCVLVMMHMLWFDCDSRSIAVNSEGGVVDTLTHSLRCELQEDARDHKHFECDSLLTNMAASKLKLYALLQSIGCMVSRVQSSSSKNY